MSSGPEAEDEAGVTNASDAPDIIAVAVITKNDDDDAESGRGHNRRRRRRKRLNDREQEKSLAATLLAISFVFIACQSVKIVPDVYDMTATCDCSTPFIDMIISVSNLLSCFNSAANFLLYMLRGEKFRTIFFEFYALSGNGKMARLARRLFRFCKCNGKANEAGDFQEKDEEDEEEEEATKLRVSTKVTLNSPSPVN